MSKLTKLDLENRDFRTKAGSLDIVSCILATLKEGKQHSKLYFMHNVNTEK